MQDVHEGQPIVPVHRPGKPDEDFEPRLEIDFGTRTILIAADLEVAPARLFEHLFRDDTRRYWHGHN